MNALTFKDVRFDVVDRNGQPWLRLLQIGVALGYHRADLVNKVYQKHADEFTDSMTALITLPDLKLQNGGTGQMREIRIFSLRGAHLLGMSSRTDKAKEFRKWVLDILERHTGIVINQPAILTINAAQQQQIKAAVSTKVRKTGLTHQAVYRDFYDFFSVPKYQDLPAVRYEEAMRWLDVTPKAVAIIRDDHLQKEIQHLQRRQDFMQDKLDRFSEYLSFLVGANKSLAESKTVIAADPYFK